MGNKMVTNEIRERNKFKLFVKDQIISGGFRLRYFGTAGKAAMATQVAIYKLAL